MTLDTAEQAVRDGDLDAALSNLQDQIRKEPANADLRVFLFQLLSVMGQWERALTQLNVAADLDAKTLAMAQMYREAIRCEVLRADVFAGQALSGRSLESRKSGWRCSSSRCSCAGRNGPRSHEQLRERAFEAAPASAGVLDGTPFEWIADADMRLGPVCEAIINGRYYWVPFARLSRIDLEAPADLRDVVWAPAHFQFDNGGEAVGLIPSRYAGSEADHGSPDSARSQDGLERDRPDVYCGLGQRVLTTDAGEHAVMDVRQILIGSQAVEHGQDATGA